MNVKKKAKNTFLYLFTKKKKSKVFNEDNLRLEGKIQIPSYAYNFV